MSEARITRHVSEHHAVQGEAEYVNRAAPEQAEAAPVAWTSLAALTAVSEGRSAWMFPAKAGDDLSGSIPLYTKPGAQTSELKAELARALAQIEDLEAECDRRHAALQGAPAPGIVEDLSQAARDVLAERQRQVSAEGWTPKLDDQHDQREMAKAAVCYVLWGAGNANGAAEHHPGMPRVPGWPWEESWWKPTTPRRDLVKAGALILAEIERLDRVDARALSGGDHD
ncbi:hypothetical protein [Paracoccus sp. TOH]|uniref:hypothetical protein n=1 Tax=Paracoccus sp. TOH TaxID=1263728 RepID=UPI0025B22BA2|nr:hypothetical protein [Paracoccus sp. TOH]WJS86736.1 hypothetical protein NBE95_19940 [Paracoccus sp. TOH]